MFDQVFLLANFETALARQKLVEKQWTSFLSITNLGLGLGFVLLSFTKFTKILQNPPGCIPAKFAVFRQTFATSPHN